MQINKEYKTKVTCQQKTDKTKKKPNIFIVVLD